MDDISFEAWDQVHNHMTGTLVNKLWGLLSKEVNKVVHDQVWNRIKYHFKRSR